MLNAIFFWNFLLFWHNKIATDDDDDDDEYDFFSTDIRSVRDVQMDEEKLMKNAPTATDTECIDAGSFYTNKWRVHMYSVQLMHAYQQNGHKNYLSLLTATYTQQICKYKFINNDLFNKCSLAHTPNLRNVAINCNSTYKDWGIITTPYYTTTTIIGRSSSNRFIISTFDTFIFTKKKNQTKSLELHANAQLRSGFRMRS